MCDTLRAADIVKTVKDAINVPLSVKTRLGWSDADNVVQFTKALEQAGADAITIHGRTKTQGYSGEADWDAVGRVAVELTIPVLVNGDIVDAASAQKALSKSGAQGFLIARGALGRPWIFKRISETLATGKDPGDPEIEERMEIIMKHALYQVEVYGDYGLIKLRKHIPWYFKGIAGYRQFRADAVRVTNLKDLKNLADKVLSHSF